MKYGLSNKTYFGGERHVIEETAWWSIRRVDRTKKTWKNKSNKRRDDEPDQKSIELIM